MVIAWNTGLAAERARHNLKLKLKNKKNKKPQATSLTIHILSGVIDSVDGLPEGWTYKVVDHGLD